MSETIADILAEMRTYFQTQKHTGNPEHRPWHQVLSDWADRIEAAAKRDQALGSSSGTKLGNAAAIREAMKQVLVGFDNNVLGPIGDIPNDWEIAEANRLCKVVAAALSAPARNCDLFARWETAKEVFEAENWQRLRHFNPYLDVIKWLFAPAEGGAK